MVLYSHRKTNKQIKGKKETMIDAADKGAVSEIIGRARKQKKDSLYIRVEGNRVIVGERVALSLRSGDSIIVLEDEFKSSYDCTVCEGSGEIEKSCLRCGGQGNVEMVVDGKGIGESCGKCGGKGKWLIPCASCNGKGALLEIPDQAKARPTSGKVVARGPETLVYSIGDRVAYSGYTGHLIPFKGNVRLRIMRETEPFCLIEDFDNGGKAKGGVDIEFIDKDTAYDLT